jgi:hypothetical protein
MRVHEKIQDREAPADQPHPNGNIEIAVFLATQAGELMAILELALNKGRWTDVHRRRGVLLRGFEGGDRFPENIAPA